MTAAVGAPVPGSDRETVLRAAEDQLMVARQQLAIVASFIHNDAWDYSARAALAQSMGLPLPTPTPTPTPERRSAA